ncbi:MAG TPA: hypothetical protein VHX62_18465 [Solirubrobacteraceae bacterium]|jgi:hypothetical protein|nr:hypothetical protein [Solirubrobacteraceae bacterium]
MPSADERFVISSLVLFDSGDELRLRFDGARRRIHAAVGSVDDDAVLEADAEDWSRRLAVELRIDAPKVDIAAAELEHEGRVTVDWTSAPELSHGEAENGPPHPGHRLRLSIPVTGESQLLVARPPNGAAPLRADLADGCAVRQWVWPEVEGTPAFEHAVEVFKGALASGAHSIGGEIDRFNASLSHLARAAIADRRRAVQSEREFLGSLSLPVKRGGAASASSWRRLLARVARWQAPPRNLLLSALVLLVLPWDDVLIDALYAGNPKLPALAVYIVWILFDASLIWVVLASGRMLRAAVVYASIAAGLDVILGLLYYQVTEYSPLYMVAIGILQTAYVALIATVMWVRLKGRASAGTWSGRWLGLGSPTDRGDQQRTRSLFIFVVPLIVSISVAYAATFAAALTCTARGPERACGSYGPPIAPGFFDQSAHIIAILLVALAIEARLLVDRRHQEERSLVGVTALGLTVGIAASLTAAAAHAETLPLTFGLTVQALAVGLTTLLMLPFLSDPPPATERAP